MGAAAVLETAAATPPTVKSIVSFGIISFYAVHLDLSRWGRYRGKRKLQNGSVLKKSTMNPGILGKSAS
jgi:hypothetical protein